MKGEKTGGRQKGSVNKVTKKARDLISDIVNDNIDTFRTNMAKLKPKDFCDVYISLCKYVIPQLQSVSFDDTTSAKKTIEEKLSELADEVEEGKKQE